MLSWRAAGTAGHRRRFAWLAAALLVAVTATSQVALELPAQAAVSRPTLAFANGSSQAMLGAAYTKALTNLLDINTVRYDPAEYGQSGLLTDPPGTFVRAGGGYPQPWTRDGALNAWNAASLLEPEVARNTLWSVVRRQANGQLIVNQDNQWWDQVVWLTGAWHHYLVTGDRRFLADAYQAGTNTLNVRRSLNYNAAYGLFQGPSFFNDGIAGYPAPPADATESRGGFVGSYPATNTMMALSTNALYYDAYRSAALMAVELSRPAGEAAALATAADALKSTINERFWIPGKGTYGYFIHDGDGMSGRLDESEEGTGLSLVILFGIADAARAQAVLRNTHVQPHGIVDVYPHFPRYSDARPGRHNNIVWPMIQGFWADAAARSGDQTRFAAETVRLAHLANTSDGFYEIYNAQTGVPDGGWQSGGHWGPLADQTWSATAYLRMIYSGLFGMTNTAGGMRFTPTLPAGWGDVSLTGVRYRGMTLSIELRGAGNVVSSFTLDGKAVSDQSVPAALTGEHTVRITLTGAVGGDRDGDSVPDATDTCPEQPGSPANGGCPAFGGGVAGAIRSGIAGKCIDVSDANNANGTRVQLWTCVPNVAQQRWSLYPDGSLRSLGKCLDVIGRGTANRTKVQIWDCNGGGNQKWELYDGGYRNLVSGRCLDDPDGSTVDGTQLQIYDCVPSTNAQKWSAPGATATGAVRSGNGGKCADVRGGSSVNGTPVQLWTCNPTAAQQWSSYPDGSLRALGKCLDVVGRGTANRTKVQIWDCQGVASQRWETHNSGYRNSVSGRCLDDPDNSTADGTQLQLYDCVASATAQEWSQPGAQEPNRDMAGPGTVDLTVFPA